MAFSSKMSAVVVAVIGVAVIFLPANVNGYTPDYYYFRDYCTSGGGSTVIFSKDAVLSWDRYGRDFQSGRCQMNIQSFGANTRVQVRFRYLDISSFNNFDCNMVNLQIRDGNVVLTPPQGVCGVTPSNLYRTLSGRTLTITLTNNRGVSTYGDFEFMVTAFYNQTVCDSGDFKCSNGICISNSLTCNGYNDCGDDSDELEGCKLAAGVIAGIVVSAIFFVICISAIGFCVRRRRLTYTRVNEPVRSYPTQPVPAGSYVPSYAQGTSYQTI